MISQISVEDFFNLFMEELEQNEDLRSYYKFLQKDNRFLFRKAYFTQRLEYIYTQLENLDTDSEILDIGCGYGTTAIFLALNGFKVKGLTLEYYDEFIPNRMEFWEKHGSASLFKWSYQNLYDGPSKGEKYQFIIAQDTLHHLEPCKEAIEIIHDLLSDNGKFIIVEENGDNLVLRALLYRQRGNKRVVKEYDKRLEKYIYFGNENVRGLSEWSKLLESSNLTIDKQTIKFIRFFFPNRFIKYGYQKTISDENKFISSFLKKYFFYSVNFVANKIDKTKHYQ